MNCNATCFDLPADAALFDKRPGDGEERRFWALPLCRKESTAGSTGPGSLGTLPTREVITS